MPATGSDSRFVADSRFDDEAEAECSSSRTVDRGSTHGGHPSPTEHPVDHGLTDGMDPEGFSGEKVVKPLTTEALAAYQAAQNRAGVIYISRIPPGMRPAKVRHLMSAYGEIGKVYLQQEGAFYSVDSSLTGLTRVI